jgi:regulator of cell morphogenesis and NO signaling
MEKTAWKDKRINDLVEENYVYAYVLHYFGIRFFDFSTHTLAEVCQQRGLNVEYVIRELETPTHAQEADLPLISYPIDLMVEYLKHAHFVFIKHKLPYVAALVEAFKPEHEAYESISRDLKLVFPLFVEDFIHHIYEEEDTLFSYILLLDRAIKGKVQPSRLYYRLERNALQKFATEHEAHDDEMMGIRRITKDYFTDANTPLPIKVVYNELKDFEKKLQTHARIENEILFPKALALEHQLRTKLFERSKWN